jgi:aspartyl aminopeptidase
MSDAAADLLKFIDASPTPYHAVRECVRRLEAEGFSGLDESDEWSLQAGDRRYVVRNDGSVAAFVVGTAASGDGEFRIVGAHTDSPNLRLRPNPARESSGYDQLAVEPYGGVLLHTWFDRDLSIAGRVGWIDSDGAARSTLVDFEKPVLRLPNLAIHLFPELKTDGLNLNAQTHAIPISGLGGDKQAFAALVAERVSEAAGSKVKAESISAYELMTYDTAPSVRCGFEDEFVSAPRLDNLGSCHAGLCALITAAASGSSTRMAVFYDHEEVGSRSGHGAAGTFLADTLSRIVQASGGGEQDFARSLDRSLLVSADMAHAVHPNYADRHDSGHKPVIGGGPVIKSNVNLSYASDTPATSRFVAACREAGVEPQYFVSRNDYGCGSTIGPITAARVGLKTVDVGNPMLSMHSCRETAGAADVEPMIRTLTALFTAGA